jgi:hypothetical protein
MTIATPPPRYPFLVTPDMPPADQARARAAGAAFLASVDRLIYRTGITFGYRGDDLEDAVQDCRIHLLEKFLPRFDTTLGTAPISPCFTYINNFFRGHRRQQRRRPAPASLTMDVAAPPHSTSNLPSCVALINRYYNILSKRQCTVLLVRFSLVEADDDTMAKALKYKNAAVFRNTLSIIKRKIRRAQMEEEGHAH